MIAITGKAGFTAAAMAASVSSLASLISSLILFSPGYVIAMVIDMIDSKPNNGYIDF